MFSRGQNLKIQVEETLLHNIRIIEESQKHTRKYQEGSLNKKFQNQHGKEGYREGNTKKRMINVVLTFKNQIVIMKTQYFSNMEAGIESNW